MKKNINLLLLFNIAIIICSCEKLIDIDLKTADKKYVVEGFLSNENNGAEVRVSQTKDFDDNNDFNGISGAQLSLINSIGNTYSFTEVTTGIYITSAFTGVPGITYSISVTVNGNSFTASSAMPYPVQLDSVFTTDFNLAGETTKNITPQYNDPVGTGNSYSFVNYINTSKENRVFVQNDDLNDGRTVTRPLINNDSKIKTGDIVRVEMQCIDKPVYKYWHSLSQLEDGGGQSATPANPVSNFSGGCLGYFSAYSVTSKTIIVQ